MPSDKQKLIEEIEAYAAAKMSGNMTLIQRQGKALEEVLNLVPTNFSDFLDQ